MSQSTAVEDEHEKQNVAMPAADSETALKHPPFPALLSSPPDIEAFQADCQRTVKESLQLAEEYVARLHQQFRRVRVEVLRDACRQHCQQSPRAVLLGRRRRHRHAEDTNELKMKWISEPDRLRQVDEPLRASCVQDVLGRARRIQQRRGVFVNRLHVAAKQLMSASQELTSTSTPRTLTREQLHGELETALRFIARPTFRGIEKDTAPPLDERHWNEEQDSFRRGPGEEWEPPVAAPEATSSRPPWSLSDAERASLSLLLSQYYTAFCRNEALLTHAYLPLCPRAKTFQTFYRIAVKHRKLHRCFQDVASLKEKGKESAVNEWDVNEPLEEAFQLLWDLMMKDIHEEVVDPATTAHPGQHLPSNHHHTGHTGMAGEEGDVADKKGEQDFARRVRSPITVGSNSDEEDSLSVVSLSSAAGREEEVELIHTTPATTSTAACERRDDEGGADTRFSRVTTRTPCVVVPLFASLHSFTAEAPWLCEEDQDPEKSDEDEGQEPKNGPPRRRPPVCVRDRLERRREAHRVSLGVAVPPFSLLGFHFALPEGLWPAEFPPVRTAGGSSRFAFRDEDDDSERYAAHNLLDRERTTKFERTVKDSGIEAQRAALHRVAGTSRVRGQTPLPPAPSSSSAAAPPLGAIAAALNGAELKRQRELQAVGLVADTMATLWEEMETMAQDWSPSVAHGTESERSGESDEEVDRVLSFLEVLRTRLCVEVTARLFAYQEATVACAEETSATDPAPHSVILGPGLVRLPQDKSETAPEGADDAMTRAVLPAALLWPLVVLSLPEVENVFHCFAFALGAALSVDDRLQRRLDVPLPATAAGGNESRAARSFLLSLPHCCPSLEGSMRLWLHLWTYVLYCQPAPSRWANANEEEGEMAHATGASTGAAAPPRLGVPSRLAWWWLQHVLLPSLGTIACDASMLLRLPGTPWQSSRSPSLTSHTNERLPRVATPVMMNQLRRQLERAAQRHVLNVWELES